MVIPGGREGLRTREHPPTAGGAVRGRRVGGIYCVVRSEALSGSDQPSRAGGPLLRHASHWHCRTAPDRGCARAARLAPVAKELEGGTMVGKGLRLQMR